MCPRRPGQVRRRVQTSAASVCFPSPPPPPGSGRLRLPAPKAPCRFRRPPATDPSGACGWPWSFGPGGSSLQGREPREGGLRLTPPASHEPGCPCVPRRRSRPGPRSKTDACCRSASSCPGSAAPRRQHCNVPPRFRDGSQECRPWQPSGLTAAGTPLPAPRAPERSPEAALRDVPPSTAPSPRSGAATGRPDGCPGRTPSQPSPLPDQDAAGRVIL